MTGSISQPRTITAGTYNLNLRAAQRGSGNASFQQLKASLQSTAVVVLSTKQFIWNGNAIAEERDANNNVTRRFYAQGEQINGTNYFYTRDHLGSVSELTDSTGTVRARYDYDPYGMRMKLSGDLDAQFGYTGHYFHQPSGLNLALYRAYNAGAGRWLNRDPIGESGGVNLYAYVSNSPVRSTDSLGLLVDAYFNVQQGLLTVVDRDTGASITLRADSGKQGTDRNNNPMFETRENGPIPRGDYEILNRIYNQPQNWRDLDELQASGTGVWALDPLDDDPRDDQGNHRCALRLHLLSGTGCVVSRDFERWRTMRDIIDHTKTDVVTDANGTRRILFGSMHVFSTTSPRAIFP